MKTKMTVAWSYTVEVEVDPSKMTDPVYVEQVKQQAEEQARAGLSLQDSLVTDCEDFPEIAD